MNVYETFSVDLAQWYQEHKRDLPWRQTTDPYKIWISEVMLQQTQVPRVEGQFYPRFIEAFPDVQTLSNATWEEVFPLWEGLGYYSRGKNLMKAAQILVSDYNGAFPQDFETLKSLPGIGAYTAAAILAFAWDKKIPAIDTNISKVIRTVFPGEDLHKTASTLVNAAESGRDWNNAMMDLASLLRAGGEVVGPLRNFFPLELLDKFIPAPRKKKKQKPKNNTKSRKFRIEVGVACIHKNGKYLLQTRPEGKSFVGHWEFPGGKREKGESLRACVKREVQEELGINVSVRPHFMKLEHEFEKTLLILYFHRCQIQAGEPQALEDQLDIKWVPTKDFDQYNFLETNHEALEKLKSMRT